MTWKRMVKEAGVTHPTRKRPWSNYMPQNLTAVKPPIRVARSGFQSNLVEMARATSKVLDPVSDNDDNGVDCNAVCDVAVDGLPCPRWPAGPTGDGVTLSLPSDEVGQRSARKCDSDRLCRIWERDRNQFFTLNTDLLQHLISRQSNTILDLPVKQYPTTDARRSITNKHAVVLMYQMWFLPIDSAQTDCSTNRSKLCHVLDFFRWQPAPPCDFKTANFYWQIRSGGSSCITVRNFIKISRTYFDFWDIVI